MAAGVFPRDRRGQPIGRGLQHLAAHRRANFRNFNLETPEAERQPALFRLEDSTLYLVVPWFKGACACARSPGVSSLGSRDDADFGGPYRDVIGPTMVPSLRPKHRGGGMLKFVLRRRAGCRLHRGHAELPTPKACLP